MMIINKLRVLAYEALDSVDSFLDSASVTALGDSAFESCFNKDN